MSQGSLFEAIAYLQKAYDQLVLAQNVHASAELESLKWQTLQAWLSLQEARMVKPFPAEQDALDIEAPF